MEQPIFREVPEGAHPDTQPHTKVPLTEAVAGDLERQAAELKDESDALSNDVLNLEDLLEKTEGQINQANGGTSKNAIPEDLNSRTLDIN